jgi:hypothetical protein
MTPKKCSIPEPKMQQQLQLQQQEATATVWPGKGATSFKKTSEGRHCWHMQAFLGITYQPIPWRRRQEESWVLGMLDKHQRLNTVQKQLCSAVSQHV